MTSEGLPPQRPSLVDVQAAARRFLHEALPEARRIDVSRVAPAASGDGWEVEAGVWQPNAAIQALGLSMQRVVLDESFYVLRLDGRLDVVAYESSEVERAS
ncbi:MAG: hypothetical protein ACLQLG_14500 [Thermoguttaceae bacterium]